MRKKQADVQARYRVRHPEYRETEAMRVRARNKASARLRERYPKQWRRFYEAELAEQKKAV